MCGGRRRTGRVVCVAHLLLTLDTVSVISVALVIVSVSPPCNVIVMLVPLVTQVLVSESERSVTGTY